MANTDPNQCDSATCLWSDGRLLIPEHDFCAPLDLTDDANVMTGCINSDEANCFGQCKWRRGRQQPAEIPTVEPQNVQTDNNGRLFTKNFCHPVIGSDNFSATLETCMSVSNKDACETSANCTWSTAVEIIPTEPFCASTNMPDYETLMGCISTPVQDCLGNCTYYMGRVPANETQFHCATINRTATIDNCQNIDSEAMCNNMASICEWRPVNDYSNMTNTTDNSTT